MRDVLSRYVVAIMAVPLINACVAERSPGSSTNDVTLRYDGYPTSAPCLGGEESMMFQLVGDTAVVPTDTTLVGDSLSFWPQQSENDERGYRFDLCYDAQNDVLRLQRAFQRLPQTSPFSVEYLELTPNSVATSATWSESIADGGSPGLEVRFKNGDDPGHSLVLKGWQKADGTKFLTMSTFDWSGSPEITTAALVMFGRLRQGDPWLQLFHPHNRLIAAPDLRVELYYDLQVGNNNYKTYRVHRVVLKDSNPSLPAPFSADLADEPSLSEHFKINYTHHSLTDSFTVTFPHGTYKIGLGVHATYTDLDPSSVDFGIECGEVSNCGTPL